MVIVILSALVEQFSVSSLQNFFLVKFLLNIKAKALILKLNEDGYRFKYEPNSEYESIICFLKATVHGSKIVCQLKSFILSSVANLKVVCVTFHGHLQKQTN